jgi:hypothetical protein
MIEFDVEKSGFLLAIPDRKNARMSVILLLISQPDWSVSAPLELPDGDEWDVFVCYINTTTDLVVRLVGPDTSVRQIQKFS